MRPLQSAYLSTQQRVADLVGAAAGRVGDPVPACPDWSVHDVLAHVTGVCTDILAGNVEGAATDPWTQAQVDSRRGAALDDLLGEWADAAGQVAAFLDDFPEPYGRQVVSDLAVHEHDIRGALGCGGERSSEAVAICLDFLHTEFVHPAAEALGLAPLHSVVTVDDFELFRALAGRRSARQIRRFHWRADPEAYLSLFSLGPFAVRSHDLVE